LIDNLDKLTGLYTRKYFRLRLDEELARTRRYKRPLSIVIFEINYKYFMPEYNIRWSMVYTILKQFGALLLRQLRNVDIAGRYGGEMFTVLLPETPLEGGKIAADRIRKRVEEHTFIGDNVISEVKLAINGGLATCPMHGKSLKEVLSSAHQGLLMSRSEGGNKIVVCPNLLYDEEGKSTLTIEGGLEEEEVEAPGEAEKDTDAPFLKKKKKGRKEIAFKEVPPEEEEIAEKPEEEAKEAEIPEEEEIAEMPEEEAKEAEIPEEEEVEKAGEEAEDKEPEIEQKPEAEEVKEEEKEETEPAKVDTFFEKGDKKPMELWKSLTEIRKIK